MPKKISTPTTILFWFQLAKHSRQGPEELPSSWVLILRSNQLHFEFFNLWHATFLSITSLGITESHAIPPSAFYGLNCFSFCQKLTYPKEYASEHLCCWQSLGPPKTSVLIFFRFYKHNHLPVTNGLRKSLEAIVLDPLRNPGCTWFELSSPSIPYLTFLSDFATLYAKDIRKIQRKRKEGTAEKTSKNRVCCLYSGGPTYLHTLVCLH